MCFCSHDEYSDVWYSLYGRPGTWIPPPPAVTANPNAVRPRRKAMRSITASSAHATWKQAPTKPARETRRTTNPITSSGVCSIDEHVAVDPFAIHRPAPITGIDARSVARFSCISSLHC
uniref:Uncharacterized protein n=1 Tax=Leersia perrieri TaxID=77586 RepID=A0A0D9WC98_9ORYZ